MFKTYLHFCILKLFPTDIDECASGVHACHKNVLYINTEGSYKCSCKNPYTGDGKICNLAAGNNQENWCKRIGANRLRLRSKLFLARFV